jgi:CheY-like chemotaxis protein
MGGELKVESTPGRGSRFWFELPLIEVAEPTLVPTDTTGESVSSDARLADDEHLTVLVADDSSVNRRILAGLLESAGVRVITAAGGIEAVELTKAHRPGLVLMDLRMSDLSGFEATRRLVADQATASIPVVAVSASAAEVRQQAREAGCVDFLPKPVKANVLFGKLQRFTGARFVSPVATLDTPLPQLSPEIATRDLAARIREAAAIGSVADLDALAEELSAAGAAPGALGQRIAALTATFDYEALLRLASSLEQVTR